MLNIVVQLKIVVRVTAKDWKVLKQHAILDRILTKMFLGVIMLIII